MAVGLTGIGVNKIELSQKMFFEAPKEITSKELKEMINSNHFRYFILNEDSLLLVKSKP